MTMTNIFVVILPSDQSLRLHIGFWCEKALPITMYKLLGNDYGVSK